MGQLLKTKTTAELLNGNLTKDEELALRAAGAMLSLLSVVTEAQMDFSWLQDVEGLRAHADFLAEFDKLDALKDEKLITGALIGYSMAIALKKA